MTDKAVRLTYLTVSYQMTQYSRHSLPDYLLTQITYLQSQPPTLCPREVISLILTVSVENLFWTTTAIPGCRVDAVNDHITR